jgi:hypothetical protein
MILCRNDMLVLAFTGINMSVIEAIFIELRESEIPELSNVASAFRGY